MNPADIESEPLLASETLREARSKTASYFIIRSVRQGHCRATRPYRTMRIGSRNTLHPSAIRLPKPPLRGEGRNENKVNGIEKIFDLKNLRRAYRWIMSNPDARYKSYFRDSYDAFAIASDIHLKWIRQEGLKERYRTSHASKILIPKPSGTMRPITLLTMEDQIVYQACVNLIADALKQRTRRRYEKRVFAHLYAGKSSPFFYLQWKRAYRKFAGRVREAHSKRYNYIANFDLAAFYDSIDHHVLKHFLKETGVDEDAIDFLLNCLRIWTSATWSTGPENIYHEHGIPQGPISSGMLSEAVLQHIDEAGEQGRKTIYLRYVDDIKILAKSEEGLRQKLIKLDITAKEIGLFPQASKINIHRITDPNEEVKSVSRPPEEALHPVVDQDKLIARVLSISRNGKINSADVTRFKYLLGHAAPSYRLNARMMKVLEKHPELASTICWYIEKYTKIPLKLTWEIMDCLYRPEIYHSVNGLLLRACLNRFTSRVNQSAVGRFCANRLIHPNTGLIQIQPTYKEALIAWGLKTNMLRSTEYTNIVFSESDWWIKKCAIRELTKDLYGESFYTKFINLCLRAKEPEVARIAASRLLRDRIKLTRPYGDVETTAKQILKEAKVIRAVGQPASRINDILAHIFQKKQTTYDWKKFFGSRHRHAECMMLDLKRDRESNINAFLVLLDSFCDFLTAEIYRRLKPGKTYPKFGSAAKDPTLNFALPNAMACFQKLHSLRLESSTAHPRSLKTGKPTRRLKHYDFYKIKTALGNAFEEIEKTITA